MEIGFRCPCGRALAIDAAHAAAKVRCPGCDAVLRVPQNAPPLPALPAPAAGAVATLPLFPPAPPPPAYAAHAAGGLAYRTPVEPRTSSLAVWSFILGLTSFLLVTAPIAFVLSLVALARILTSEGRLTGVGYAVAGLVSSLALGSCVGSSGRWLFRHLF